jgi:hypothetical protein
VYERFLGEDEAEVKSSNMPVVEDLEEDISLPA